MVAKRFIDSQPTHLCSHDNYPLHVMREQDAMGSYSSSSHFLYIWTSNNSVELNSTAGVHTSTMKRVKTKLKGRHATELAGY